MRKAALALAGAVAIALLLVALGSRTPKTLAPGKPLPGPAAPESPRTAPDFALKDTNGNLVDSSRLRGKPLVVNFFATWCPPCREEIPGFVEVYKRYRGRGLELVGISLDTDTRGNLAIFMMHYGIGYPILYGDVATVTAFGGFSALPTTFFIGRDGVIRKVHSGYLDVEEFDREVRKIL